MCTAITFTAANHYFGRNLDLERKYDEQVTITPKNYIFRYKSGEIIRRHYAMIGTAMIVDDYPLYYDAANEFGLSIAGLNFVKNSFLGKIQDNKINLAPYELIPYLLGSCKNVDESIKLLQNINLVDIPFNSDYRNPELHWIIADKYNNCITVEFVREGTKIHQNPIGILTNNPPFEFQIMNLNNYLNLTNTEAKNRFSNEIDLEAYSRGMGSIGMPGDPSSMSRFVRAAFTKLNAIKPQNELDSVGQMFHLLASVEQQEGSVRIGSKYQKTQYSCCCNIEKGIYYYTTYNNHQITAINMFNEDLDSNNLISYRMIFDEQIKKQN